MKARLSGLHRGEVTMLRVGEQTREFVVLAELQHDRFLVEDRYAHCHAKGQRRFIASARKLEEMMV